MKELLEKYGWYKFHQCTCGGTLKQKFKHPNKPAQEIHIQPNRNTWKHLVNRIVVANGVSNSLEDKLKEI